MTAIEVYTLLSLYLFPVSLCTIVVMFFTIAGLNARLRHMKYAHSRGQDNRWATVARLQDLVEDLEGGMVFEQTPMKPTRPEIEARKECQ